MRLIKIIDLILIVVTSSCIGINKSKMFGKRVIELKKIKNALSIFKNKIEFTYEPIKEVFGDVSNILYGGQDNIFKSFCIMLDDMDATSAWKEAVNSTNLYLTKDDKEIIAMLGKMLGKTDIAGQIDEINMITSFLDKQIESSEESKNKNEKLYKTLGGVIGLCIAIVLL